MTQFINRKNQVTAAFLNDARKSTILSQAEESKLIATAQGGGEAAIHARNKLVEANLLYLVSEARKISQNGEINDLVNEGALGLMEAIARFDPAKEVKLLTYARPWIEKNMRAARDKSASILSTPDDLSKIKSKVNKASNEFFRTYGYNPTAQDLSEELGMSVKRINAAMNSTHGLSMDAPLGDEDDRTYGDTFACADYYEADRDAMRNSDRVLVHRMLEVLTEKELNTVKMYFGFDGGMDLSLTEIATRLGTSHESVRKTFNRAERKLRQVHDRYQQQYAIAS